MRIMVTGGAGFIGSHVVRVCLDAGHEVAVLDDFSTGRLENVDPRAVVFRCDVRDRCFVTEAMESFRPDVVCHQAAMVDVCRCEEMPDAAAAVNTTGTAVVLEVAEACDVRRLVFASSAGAYGECSEPATEDTPLSPVGAYATSKRDAEMRLEDALIPVSILRYSNVYGDIARGGVIPAFVDAVAHHEPPVIYGTGEQVRDFVHVEDVALANLLAIEQESEGHSGPEWQVLNIASGQIVSVNELWRMLSTRQMPTRAAEVVESRVDAGKAFDELGFRAQVDLRAGLETLLFSGQQRGVQCQTSE